MGCGSITIIRNCQLSDAPMAIPTAEEPTKAALAFVRSRFATKSAMYRREIDRAAPETTTQDRS